MKRKQILIMNLILHSLVVILGSIAIAIQFKTTSTNNSVSMGGWHVFRFFTNDGNIFCMVVSLITMCHIIYSLVKGDDVLPKWIYILNLMSAVSGLLIFFTVLFVLWPTLGPRLFVGYLMVVLHVVNPILVSTSFLFTMHKDTRIKEGLYGMVPMLVYGVPVITLIITKVWTGNLIPYPFLKVYDNPWWGTMLMIIGMLSFCSILGIILTRLTKRTHLLEASKKKLLITLISLGICLLSVTTLVVVLNIMY